MLSFRKLRKTLRKSSSTSCELINCETSTRVSPYRSSNGSHTSVGVGVQIPATPPTANTDGDHALFNYTSGRWLYNESQRLRERYLHFNVPELKKIVAKAVNKDEGDVKSLSKLAEGGFNRTFKVTMKDGMQIIARMPYPSTLPKRYAVASEVATMDLVRTYGLPVPQIYAYAITADNPVGSEYIIMEKVQGREIGHAWYDLSVQEKKSVTLDVAKLEASLFTIPLPASGSVYYKKDLLATDRSIDIQGHDGLCIGPDVALSWWYDRRDSLSIDRGPWVSTTEVMHAGAHKELAWMKQFGRPRFPFDRHSREFLGYRKSSPNEYINYLELYLQIAPHLIPKTPSLLRPTIRHPDLQPHNIFVSDDFKIVGLIDWQHCSILPLFLQAGVPKYWRNTSDEPVVIAKPTLPSNYEQLDEAEKHQVMQEYRQRQLHLLYLGGTTRFNPTHMDAYLIKGLSFKRRIYEHVKAPWEGDNTTLKADLVLATQNWKGLTATKESEKELPQDSMDGPACPISFRQEEADESLQVDLLLQGVNADMAGVRENIGIGSDGWIPNEEYDGAVERNTYIRQRVIDQAESDEARELSLRHYPFDDHDEDD